MSSCPSSFCPGCSVIKFSYKVLVNAPNARVILQNPDDIERWVRWGVMRRERIVLIRGAGVDTETFKPSPEPPGEPVVLLHARFLFDKGIGEYVEAARRLRSEGVKARFLLVGEPDARNPEAIPADTLAAWGREGAVEVHPWRDDVARLLSEASIVCLPSYGEGLPKSLLEAAAAGRPIVTTDVPGCREVVRHGDNGLLVPARRADGLCDALRSLITDDAMRRDMGRRGRERALAEFSAERVAAETLAVYRELLDAAGIVAPS
jgi:glycosyltransferase involved in cell wall biosynthesis